MANEKPWVAAACICERVLVEKDGVNSLVRVVDTFSVQMPDALPEGVKVALDLTVYVSLKSGDLTGRHEVGLVLHLPNGKTSPVQSWPVVLKGEETGANLILRFQLGDPEPGLYWFDVLWGEDVLTRIPLRIKQLEKPTSEEQTSSP